MQHQSSRAAGSAGFSLVELMVALGITLAVMVIAAQMLAQSMSVRARENARAEAIADVQRGLQMMTREIANAGLGMSNNGIVVADSDALQLRIRANLNAFGEDPPDTSDPEEDVVFTIINNNTGGETQRLITRQDVNTGRVSPLANRVDTLEFQYLLADGTPAATTPDAVKVRVVVGVLLPAVGSPGRAGYQPASRVQLTSDVTLRNLDPNN